MYILDLGNVGYGQPCRVIPKSPSFQATTTANLSLLRLTFEQHIISQPQVRLRYVCTPPHVAEIFKPAYFLIPFHPPPSPVVL